MSECYADILEGLPPVEYHASDAVSNSDLKLLANSPADLKAKMDGLIKPSTDALFFGEVLHCAIFEPERYAEEFIAKPDGMSFSEKTGKEWRASQTKRIVAFKTPGLNVRTIEGMAQSALSHPVAGPFLRTKGRHELSLFADHERTGIRLRCRLDKLTSDNVVIDLKSTVCARPFKFVRQMALQRYHQQAAFYAAMVNRVGIPYGGFVFIAIEKTPPYKILCCELDAMSMDKGRSEVERLLALYKKCRDEDHWPGYSDKLTPELLSLPEWALREEPFESAVSYELEETIV